MVRTNVLLGTVSPVRSAYAANSFPPHQGDSPWSFSVIAEPSDTFVVNDRDSATIDRYLFRSRRARSSSTCACGGTSRRPTRTASC